MQRAQATQLAYNLGCQCVAPKNILHGTILYTAPVILHSAELLIMEAKIVFVSSPYYLAVRFSTIALSLKG